MMRRPKGPLHGSLALIYKLAQCPVRFVSNSPARSPTSYLVGTGGAASLVTASTDGFPWTSNLGQRDAALRAIASQGRLSTIQREMDTLPRPQARLR